MPLILLIGSVSSTGAFILSTLSTRLLTLSTLKNSSDQENKEQKEYTQEEYGKALLLPITDAVEAVMKYPHIRSEIHSSWVGGLNRRYTAYIYI